MIKENEIVIGRFFNVPREDQSPFRIDCIEYLSGSNGKVGMYPIIDGKVREDLHPLTWQIQDLSPIPLDPTWLERAGFLETYAKNCYEKRFHKYSLHSLAVTISQEGNVVSVLDEYSTKEHLTVFTRNICQYVHQLQNLYFALTGEELTFKPAPNE